jgi:hypothetical protein
MISHMWLTDCNWEKKRNKKQMNEWTHIDSNSDFYIYTKQKAKTIKRYEN